jgi:hypothetical protein
MAKKKAAKTKKKASAKKTKSAPKKKAAVAKKVAKKKGKAKAAKKASRTAKAVSKAARPKAVRKKAVKRPAKSKARRKQAQVAAVEKMTITVEEQSAGDLVVTEPIGGSIQVHHTIHEGSDTTAIPGKGYDDLKELGPGTHEIEVERTLSPASGTT